MNIGPRPGVPRRAVVAGLAVLLTGAACTTAPPVPRRLRIASGGPAGADDIGTTLAGLINQDLAGVEASVVTAAAPAGAVDLVARGAAEIGFAQADILSAETSVTALARVYDDLLHLVVAADSPISTVEDLRGRRVSAGAFGSGTAVTAGRVLALAGMAAGTYERLDLGLDAAVTALARGEIDAFFHSGGLPVAAIARLSATTRLRVLDLSRWAVSLRGGYGDVYAVRNVPASAYQTAPSATIAGPNLLVASASMPEDLAHDVTRLLLERRDALTAAHPAVEGLDVRSAIATMPVSLHPGAARYYRSVKP